MLSTVDATRLAVAQKGMKGERKHKSNPLPSASLSLSFPGLWAGYYATWQSYLQIARGVAMIRQYYGLGREENETVSRFAGA